MSVDQLRAVIEDYTRKMIAIEAELHARVTAIAWGMMGGALSGIEVPLVTALDFQKDESQTLSKKERFLKLLASKKVSGAEGTVRTSMSVKALVRRQVPT